jgi:hypothetical protein
MAVLFLRPSCPNIIRRFRSADQSRLDLWKPDQLTEQNSSAPDTEREIVATESYGRQLGWVIDALVELIAEQTKSTQQKPAIKELVALRNKIEKIKSRSAAHRLDRIAADLTVLRTGDNPEYRRVVQKLRAALADQDRPPA